MSLFVVFGVHYFINVGVIFDQSGVIFGIHFRDMSVHPIRTTLSQQETSVIKTTEFESCVFDMLVVLGVAF